MQLGLHGFGEPDQDSVQVSVGVRPARRHTQQVGRMEGHTKWDTLPLPPRSAKVFHTLCGSCEYLSGGSTERHNHTWTHLRQLLQQEARTGRQLVRQRLAITRRPTEHGVADVDVVAGVAHPLDEFREQAARASDEWLSVEVFLFTRRLTDKRNWRRSGETDTENDVRALVAKRTVEAVQRALAQRNQISDRHVQGQVIGLVLLRTDLLHRSVQVG